MRLAELNPQFIDAGCGSVTKDGWWPAVLRKGVGVMFDCPIGCGKRHYVGFQTPLDGGDPVGDGPKWAREGKTFEDLTLVPSIHLDLTLGECIWHGHITKGEITG